MIRHHDFTDIADLMERYRFRFLPSGVRRGGLRASEMILYFTEPGQIGFSEIKKGRFSIWTVHTFRGRLVPTNVNPTWQTSVRHVSLDNQAVDAAVRRLRAAFPTLRFWRDYIEMDEEDYAFLRLMFMG